VISALDFWSMGEGRGGPALWQTLKGYAERGWQVHFITGNCAKGGADNPHENIHVFHFDASWLKRVMQVKKIGFFAKILWWLYFYCTLSVDEEAFLEIAGLAICFSL